MCSALTPVVPVDHIRMRTSGAASPRPADIWHRAASMCSVRAIAVIGAAQEAVVAGMTCRKQAAVVSGLTQVSLD